MAKFSTLVISAASAGKSAFNGNRNVGNKLFKGVLENGIREFQDDKTLGGLYESDGSCLLRSELSNFGDPICCDFREEYDQCTGCVPEHILDMSCHNQPKFAYEYYVDENGEVDYTNYWFTTSRDCFCDMRCMDYGDCCDDIMEACPHFFSPQTETTWTVEWPSGKPTSTVFIAGIGKTQDEAIELCAENGGRIMNFNTEADVGHFFDFMEFDDKHQVRFHTPYKNIKNGGYATEYKGGHWNGKWIEADTKQEPPAGMKTYWAKKSSTDGQGQCSVVQGSFLGNGRLKDYTCDFKATAICERVDQVIPYVNDFGEVGIVDYDYEEEETTLAPTTTTTTTTTTMAPEDVFSHEDLMTGVAAYVLNNAINNDSMQRSASGTDYKTELFCSKNVHPDIAEWFDGVCPPKTLKVHNTIIKTVDNFTKKIDKDGKKVMNFSHSKCDKKVVFHNDIFDGFIDGTIDLSLLEEKWKLSIDAQLGNTGINACGPQANKLKTSVTKIFNYLPTMVSKTLAAREKQATTFAKEVAKAIKDFNKAQNGK